jgi:hypothetical protein
MVPRASSFGELINLTCRHVEGHLGQEFASRKTFIYIGQHKTHKSRCTAFFDGTRTHHESVGQIKGSVRAIEGYTRHWGPCGPLCSAFVYVGRTVPTRLERLRQSRHHFKTQHFHSNIFCYGTAHSSWPRPFTLSCTSSRYQYLRCRLWKVLSSIILTCKNFCTKIALSASHCARYVIAERLISVDRTHILSCSSLEVFAAVYLTTLYSDIWRCFNMSWRFKPT